MRVNQILSAKRSDVVHVAPSASIGTAVGLMTNEHVGAVLVLDQDGGLVGVISERDVVHGLASDPAGLLNRAVIEIVRKDGPVTALQDTVQSVMEVMTATRTRHVPVVQHGRVIGIVSIGDIVKSRLDEKTQENAVLQEIARAQFFAR
jgi:CBS domain-containing protein